MTAAQLSGGHLNPAISLMMFTTNKICAKTFVVYCIAQTIGAFLGAMLTYFFYIDAINFYDGGVRAVQGENATAGIFSTYPPEYLSISGAYLDQIVGTAMLCFLASVVTDPRNKLPEHLHALFFGFIVITIGTSFGMHLGYPINPARDFGPRLFTLFIYGSEVFRYPYSSYFLVPIIGPLLGALLGTGLYHVFIGAQIPDLIDGKQRVKRVEYELCDRADITEKSLELAKDSSE
ncbi:hypothetical protein L596_003180 [Steinernema carpocapsae]|nr:hypothetical protein L596_003180 [Steinernema carpocapsae]